MIFKSIGTIYTPYKSTAGMPIQPGGAKGVRGSIVLKKKFVKGLLDLEGFSHIYLIYYFHKSHGYKLQVIPFLDNKTHGVFSTRAPKRPNSIGISVVKLISINDNILEIENVDMVAGTPLLDIKPYIPDFDFHEDVKKGWYSDRTNQLNEIKSDTRFK